MRFAFTLAAALAISACATIPPGTMDADTVATVADSVNAPPPVVLADRTTIDESAGIAFETAVAAAADLATLAVQTGVVPTDKLPALKARVAQARVAVRAVRAAYDTGNAASYRAAVSQATCAVNAVRTLSTGAPDAPCTAGAAR